MRLDRVSLIHAAKFIKPAILVSEEQDASCYVHVQPDGDKCVLTSTNGKCGKRVTLVKPVVPIDIDEGLNVKNFRFTGGPEPEEYGDDDVEYLIPKPAFEAYQTLCERHNAKLKNQIRRDITLSFIDIFPRKLKSCTQFVDFELSPYTFPDVERFFSMNKSPVSEFNALPQYIADAMKDFDKYHPVEVSLSENVIHIEQFNGAYQAWFLTEEV